MTKNRTISIERAKALAERWKAQHEEHTRTSALAGRFKDATPAELIRIYESGSDDRGRKLSQGEFAALVELWLEVFGAYTPSEDDVSPVKRVDAHVRSQKNLNPKTIPCSAPRHGAADWRINQEHPAHVQ
jgi:hypothetical protein